MRVIAAVVLAVCVAAFALSGCGSSNEKFSSAESDRAMAALDAIQQYVDDGECAKAQSRVNKLALQATHINEDRADLGEAYASSVARLQELVDRECVEITPTGPTTEPTDSTGPTSEPKPDVTPTPETGGNNDTTGGGAQPDNTPGGGDQNNGDNNGQQDGGDQTQPNPGDSGGASPQG
jgi:hypothetical protein